MNAKLALFVAILIAGCSSSPVTAPQEKKEEKSPVIANQVMPSTTSTIIFFEASSFVPFYGLPTNSCCRNIGNKWWRW